MMRTLLPFLLCGAIAAPGAALAQDAPALAPLPTVEPARPVAEPLTAKPPPAPVRDAAQPVATTPPTTVAPVLVEKPDKDSVGDKLGTVVGGVAGGVAGAAVAGPVGKFAGGFLGKKLAKGLLGGKKDDIPEVTVANAAPSADAAGRPAVAAPATAPPLQQSVALNRDAGN
jgi:uncharacterized protein YcfJ